MFSFPPGDKDSLGTLKIKVLSLKVDLVHRV